jgi:hypothetical protein
VVVIEAATADGRLRLGGGREVEALTLASELVAALGKGDL